MKKFFLKYSGKSVEGFRKSLAIKQAVTAIITSLIVILLSILYIFNSVTGSLEVGHTLHEALVLYAPTAVIYIILFFLLLIFISKGTKFWRVLETLTVFAMALLPFWGGKIIYLGDGKDTTVNILFWVVCVVAFCFTICTIPIISVSVFTIVTILLIVLCKDKLAFGELLNCSLFSFACVWGSWSRFYHEYSAFKANLDKDSYHARLTHEIRTPINAVIGTNELIKRDTKDPKILEYSSDISSASTMLLSIVNDILDLSKLESGKMQIVNDKYSLSGLCHDLEKMIRYRAESSGLSFNVELNDELPDIINGDEIRVKQIVMNLLTNAVKYTETGSVTLKVDGVVIGDDIKLVFHIIDTGIGIKNEDIKRLQEDFYRIEEKRNHKVEGTGLGLNIVTMLLGVMNGKMSVISEYGVGSEFTVTIPQKVLSNITVKDILSIKAPQSAVSSVSIEDETLTYPNAHVLLVDDNAMNRKLFLKLLSYSQIDTIALSSGAEMLEAVQEDKYDLIFLDHLMPEMDGIETITKFKELDTINNDTPVIALTANEVTDGQEYYVKYGFSNYLSKPIVITKLEAILKEYLMK